MLLYQLFERDETSPVPDDVLSNIPRISSTEINVTKSIVPEQREWFDSIKATIPMRCLTFPVLHVYEEAMTDNIDRQDALKMRRPEFQTDEHKVKVSNLIGVAIKQAMGYEGLSNSAQGNGINKTKGNTALIARSLNKANKFNCIVVPLPSSSQLSSMIASQVAATMSAPISQALTKVDRPRFSHQSVRTKDGSVAVDPLDSTIPRAELAEVEKYVAAFDTSLASPQEMVQFNKVVKRQESLEHKVNQIESTKYARKTFMNRPDTNYGKAFYGNFNATDAAKSLHGKRVMFIDDNIAKGHTFAEAAKALFEAGIIPAQIFGFVLHKFDM